MSEQEEPQQNTPQDQQPESLPALDKKEIRVNVTDNTKRVMYLIKEFLLNNDYVNLISGTGGAPISVRAAESLVRLGYVHYELIKTDTVLNQKERRKTKLFSIDMMFFLWYYRVIILTRICYGKKTEKKSLC